MLFKEIYWVLAKIDLKAKTVNTHFGQEDINLLHIISYYT